MHKFASYSLSFIAVILLAILGEQLQDFRMCGLNKKERGLSRCFQLESERAEQCRNSLRLLSSGIFKEN